MNLNLALKSVPAAIKVGGKFAVKHLPTILTAVGTAGVIFGTIHGIKRAPEAHAKLQEVKDQWNNMPAEEKEKHDKIEYRWKLIKVGTRYYGIVALVIGGSIVCFWIANHLNLKRLAAALAGLKIATDNNEDLKKQIKEIGGDKALTKAQDNINAEKIQKSSDIPFDLATLNHTVGECPVYDPFTHGWMISSADKIRHARGMVIEELANQLISGEEFAFVPYGDFLDWCGMVWNGPSTYNDGGDQYLGFGVYAPSDAKFTKIGKDAKQTYYELAEQAVDVDWTSELKNGEIPCLALRYDNEPKYNQNKGV